MTFLTKNEVRNQLILEFSDRTLGRKMFVREKIKGTMIPNELISSAGFRKCSISKSTIIPMDQFCLFLFIYTLYLMTSGVFLLDFYGFVFCPKMVIFDMRSFSIKNLSEFSKITISISVQFSYQAAENFQKRSN